MLDSVNKNSGVHFLCGEELEEEGDGFEKSFIITINRFNKSPNILQQPLIFLLKLRIVNL